MSTEKPTGTWLLKVKTIQRRRKHRPVKDVWIMVFQIFSWSPQSRIKIEQSRTGNIIDEGYKEERKPMIRLELVPLYIRVFIFFKIDNG